MLQKPDFAGTLVSKKSTLVRFIQQSKSAHRDSSGPTLPESCSKLFNLFVSAGTNWPGHYILCTLACSLRERHQFAFGELVNRLYDLISAPIFQVKKKAPHNGMRGAFCLSENW
jgi:hypothetical protein